MAYDNKNTVDITLTNGAPDSYNCREHGHVSRVKKQLKCGSCYAFSTVGN